MPASTTMDAIIRESGPSDAQSGVNLGTRTPNDCTDVSQPKYCLSSLHQRTVALQLSVDGHDCLVLGRGVSEHDPEFGRVLRIECPLDAYDEFLIREESWNGEIHSGEAQGCDFLIRLN